MAGANRQTWAFDCEWAPDLVAGRRLYHLGSDVPDDEVLRVMWEQGGATEEKPQPFLKTVLCRSVSIAAVVRVEDKDGVEVHLWTLPEKPEDVSVTESDILKRFLGKFGRAKPTLVGYNSRFSDLHILAQRAIVNGLSLPEFAKQVCGKPWDMDAVDLMDVVGGFKKGATCSLHEIANLCDIPGKLDTTGDDVARLFYGGKRRAIVEYNAFDALTTYLLWLRVEHFKGTFGTTQYAEEQQRVRDLLKTKSAEPDGAFLKRYLAAWDALRPAEYGII